MPKKPPAPPKPRTVSHRKKEIKFDPLARTLAKTLRDSHGTGATYDMSEEMGKPRGYVGTRNIALERALGVPGIPLGRVTEISGWEGAGKSTMLDQIFAECQAQGGTAALADIERARFRSYMFKLGVTDQLIDIQGKTIEEMFSEAETLIRKSAHENCLAWCESLNNAGIKVAKPPLYDYLVPNPEDPKDPKKSLAKHKLVKWGRQQAAALMEWQKANGIPAYGIRDSVSRERLRPATFHTPPEDFEWLGTPEDARKAWQAGEEHPLAIMADRPLIIGWDSVAGTASHAEMEANAFQSKGQPADAARVIKYNFRRLIASFAEEAVAFVLVNQRYKKIMEGGRGRKHHGPTSETYGGGGIKYHATIRIELDKVGDFWERASDKESKLPPIGQVVRIRVPKNKVESPFHVENYGLTYGRGCDNAWAIYHDLKARGIIRVGGGWSSFPDKSIMGSNDSKWHGWMGLANLCVKYPALYPTLHAIYMEGRQ
jgi:RecA/RadA recombinase